MSDGRKDIVKRQIVIDVEHDRLTNEVRSSAEFKDVDQIIFHEALKGMVRMAKEVAERNGDPIARGFQLKMVDAIIFVISGFETQLHQAKERAKKC